MHPRTLTLNDHHSYFFQNENVIPTSPPLLALARARCTPGFAGIYPSTSSATHFPTTQPVGFRASAGSHAFDVYVVYFLAHEIRTYKLADSLFLNLCKFFRCISHWPGKIICGFHGLLQTKRLNPWLNTERRRGNTRRRLPARVLRINTSSTVQVKFTM